MFVCSDSIMLRYIQSFVKIGWAVAEKIVEESYGEMDKLLLLIG